MDLGDIVEIDGNPLLVVQVDAVTAVLQERDGALRSVPRKQEIPVRCNPYRDWPFVILPPQKARDGSVVEVSRPKLRGDSTVLSAFDDWLVGEPLRKGGALYLRPGLGLRPFDRVLLKYEHAQTSVVIPRNFRTLGRRVAMNQLAKIEPERRTVYDHLLGPDLGDDE